jgi:hypothetical protein
MSKLHIIDFSDGIRSEEIQENFEMLNGEISRERLSIGGPGIASGLEIEPIVSDSQFAIKVSAASIVDNNGDEIYIEEQLINIERPRLLKQLEYLTADINNQVVLKEVPYSLDRICPAQYGESLAEAYSGIKILYQNSTSIDDYIRVKSIKGKVLVLTGLIRRQVAVEYYSTARRIDVVYIDEHNQVKVQSSSITSTTPSVIMPEKYKYLIAYIQVENEYTVDALDTPHAYITIKKDLRSSRNLYTDDNGTLYICGTAFNDLHLISTEEPIEPKPNQLWLNGNTLYVYQAVDSYTYKRSFEMTYGSDVDGFQDFETNIDFCINKKQLNVYLNSRKLQDSEFEELFGMLPVSIQTIPPNTFTNMFRVYAAINAGDIITYTITFNESGYKWVPVNKESYVNIRESMVYGVDPRWKDGNYWTSPQADALGVDPDDLYPHKYKYFIFDVETNRNMFFTPGKNEIDVLINQTPLHRDQFTEIDLNMIFSLPQDVQNAIEKVYGWDGGRLSTLSDLYDDVGIGIMLNEPLDAIFGEGLFDENNKEIIEKELYVEITVNRACSNVSTTRKLQRSAVYIYEDSIEVKNTSESTITLEDCYYRFNENQLEVYINGSKLNKGIDFEEGTDLDPVEMEDGSEYTGYYDKLSTYNLKMRGQISRQFTILRPINLGDIISYRITSNFYSYDHINSLLDDIEIKQDACDTKVQTLYENTLEFCHNAEVAIGELKDQMAIFSGQNSNNLDAYLTRESVIGEEQFEDNVAKRIPQSTEHISYVHNFGTYNGIGLDVTEHVREEDFIMVWWRDTANSNIDRLLIRDLDYTIDQTISGNGMITVYLKILEPALSNIKTNDKIIIQGIKFGRAGR